jgi:transcriptional regulator with XRE-family HTH domain
MTTFGKRLTAMRKEKGLSQDALAQQVGTMGVVLGRYERDEVKPSIEVAAKLSEALGVSLDYLVGNSDVRLDKELIKRITEIQQLSDEDRNGIFYALDGLLRDAKARKAYA